MKLNVKTKRNIKSEIFWRVFLFSNIRRKEKVFCFYEKWTKWSVYQIYGWGTEESVYRIYGYVALYWPHTLFLAISRNFNLATEVYSASPKISTMPFVWKWVIFIYFCVNLRSWGWNVYFCVILCSFHIFSCISFPKKKVNQADCWIDVSPPIVG